jgi:class 3 adenylate cyclase
MTEKNITVYDETILRSYCPDVVLSKLHRRRDTDLEVEAKAARGACLLADISGFTKLSGQLCSTGVRGLDDLRKVTSTFLSKFISLVYAFGGDVISFAGDALICLFWSDNITDPEEDQRVCRNAVECGFVLKDHCTDKLTAHIAISVGDLCFSFLGGHNNDWVYVINGRCMAELSHCIDDAASKQLVITPGCFSCLDDETLSRISFTKLESENYLIESVRLSSESVAKISMEVIRKHSRRGGLSYGHHILRFLPAPVVASLQDGYYDAISELRIVTTLFLKIDTYSFEKHRKLTTLQTFFHMIQTCIAASGGCLRQFLVDDKGCVLIVLWGVPSATFANNNSRSLYCASLIQNSSHRFRHVCSVGITTGSAFCGTIGSALRQDYAAIGNSVNMAARLMGKAKGRILVDQETSRTLPELLRQQLQPTEPLHLKGSTEPIVAYSFRAESLNENIWGGLNRKNSQKLTVVTTAPSSPQRNHETPLTPGLTPQSQASSIAQSNLNPEITSTLINVANRLKEKNRSSLSEQMQVIVVEGAQGMGKTEVATYFRRLCQQRRVRCYSVRAQDEDEMVEYGVSRRLINLFLNEDLHTSPRRKETTLSLLHQTYPDLTPEDIVFLKFPLLKQALALHWHLSLRATSFDQNIPIPEFKKSFSSRYLLASTLVDLSQTILGRIPTAIIIDDAHHCDKLTWNYFHMMSITLQLPIVMLVIVRKLSIEEMMIPSMMISNRHLNTADTSGCLSPQSTRRGGDGAPTPRGIRLKKARGFRLKKTPVMVAVDSLLSDSKEDCEHPNIRLHLTDLTFDQTTNILSSILPPTASVRMILVCFFLCSLLMISILSSRLPFQQISESFVELVCEVSLRNPYWTIAIAEFVREVGVNNFCKGIDATTASVGISSSSSPPRPRPEPASSSTNKSTQLIYLRHLVTCMMDLLTVTEQIILKYSSVIGLKFSLHILSEILPNNDSKTRLKGAIKTLVERRFIMHYPSEDSIYTFQNYNIREVIYSLIPPRYVLLLS